jgi:hypothetical protein
MNDASEGATASEQASGGNVRYRLVLKANWAKNHVSFLLFY